MASAKRIGQPYSCSSTVSFLLGCKNGTDLLYHHAEYGGDRTSHADCRQKSVMFLPAGLHVGQHASSAFTQRSNNEFFAPPNSHILTYFMLPDCTSLSTNRRSGSCQSTGAESRTTAAELNPEQKCWVEKQSLTHDTQMSHQLTHHLSIII